MTSAAWIGDAAGVGRFVDGPAITAYDRGFALGYGLFETTRVCRGGRLPLWERHMARLTASARALGLPAPPAERLRAASDALLERVGLDDGVLRVTLTAGDSGPQFVLTTRVRLEFGRPLRLATVAAVRAAGDPTVAHKTTSRLFWVLAQREAEAAGADEALVRDPDGAWAETTNGNLFVEIDDVWVTPPADGRILPGVARAVLIDGLRAAGCRVDERRLRSADAAVASRVAVTNAVYGPRPAVVDGAIGGPAVGELSEIWTAALSI